MAVLKEEKSLARFERIAVVLSGGGALGAYQAGALAALEAGGYQVDWLAGAGTGAFNAAIIAGNAPRHRVARLRNFWRRLAVLGREATPPSLLTRTFRHLSPRRWHGAAPPADRPAAPMGRLRALLADSVDFARINSGAARLSLATLHLPSQTETLFDNDRHVIGPDHVLASASLPLALPPLSIGGEPYAAGGYTAATSVASLFDAAPPADTLCFVIDCCDPAPPGAPELSRARRDIAAYRRRHDLRRIIALLGEHLPGELRRDREIGSCLAQGSAATVNLVHLVHESDAAGLTAKIEDFSPLEQGRHWRAGERDMRASLDCATWLMPPSRHVGVVVHELRGGVAMSSS